MPTKVHMFSTKDTCDLNDQRLTDKHLAHSPQEYGINNSSSTLAQPCQMYIGWSLTATSAQIGYATKTVILLADGIWSQDALSCQTSSKSVNPLKRYCNFSIFKMASAAILDLEILKFY